MNADASAKKIKMLKASLRCFVYGLLSLIPLFGFPFAIGALWISGRVRVTERNYWNAARPYRIWGVACAAFGTIFWFCILSLIISNAVFNSNGSGNYGGGGE